MQSNLSKIICFCLRVIFHSPLVDNENLTTNTGHKTIKVKSHYRPPKDFVLSKHQVNNTRYEELKSKYKNTDKVILLMHGGGYKIKLLDIYRRLAEKYSKSLDYATVINLDYRLYPEYKYPTQLEDAVTLYKELLNQNIKPENITVIGDSSGANLALSSALWLRDNNYPLPNGIVCFSLWGDMTSSGKSRIKNAYKDPFEGIAKRKSIKDNWDYLHRISVYAENLNRKNPYVSPCFAEFTNFPKVTLVCGTAEMDESDTDTVYEKMKLAGVDVVLYKYEDMFHDFQLVSFLPESKDAYKKVIERIKGE